MDSLPVVSTRLLRLFLPGGCKIRESYEYDASDHIADRNCRQIVEASSGCHGLSGRIEQHFCKQGHIGNTVFKACRDKCEQTPEDHDQLAGIAFCAEAAPYRQADQHITEGASCQQGHKAC